MSRYRRSYRYRQGVYRSRNGILLGVCSGLAEYFDFSVFWVRVLFIGVFLLTGFWPLTGLYLLAALLMKSDPRVHSRI